MKKSRIFFIKSLTLLALPISLFANTNNVLFIEYDDYLIPIVQSTPPTSSQPACLNNLFQGNTGTLKNHTINLDFTGRVTIGDLNADGYPDYVVSSRNRIAAYDVCGVKLWDKSGLNTNWDVNPIGSGQSEESHPYWNWSSYGVIGDADGDGNGEFLHIGSNWRTLYVRDGLSGNVKSSIDIGSGKWMYVQLGRRSGESGDKATRIFTAESPGHLAIKAFDMRDGSLGLEWSKVLICI